MERRKARRAAEVKEAVSRQKNYVEAASRGELGGAVLPELAECTWASTFRGNNNFVVQVLLVLADADQKSAFVEGLRGQVQNVCSNRSGSRIMVQLVRQYSEELGPILTELLEGVGRLRRNGYGRYVVEALVERGLVPAVDTRKTSEPDGESCGEEERTSPIGKCNEAEKRKHPEDSETSSDGCDDPKLLGVTCVPVFLGVVRRPNEEEELEWNGFRWRKQECVEGQTTFYRTNLPTACYGIGIPEDCKLVDPIWSPFADAAGQSYNWALVWDGRGCERLRWHLSERNVRHLLGGSVSVASTPFVLGDAAFVVSLIRDPEDAARGREGRRCATASVVHAIVTLRLLGPRREYLARLQLSAKEPRVHDFERQQVAVVGETCLWLMRPEVVTVGVATLRARR